VQNELDVSAAAPDGASLVRGSNQSGMRAHNERLVLSLIRQRGPMAKADIARASGLSAQTVSVIMRALESDGLLIKGAPVRGKVGQPSVPMRLAEDGAYFLGLKIGRRSAELVLTNFLGRVQNRVHLTHRFPTPAATIDFACNSVAQLLAQLAAADRAKVAGLGIAMPFQLWAWARALSVPDSAMAAWRDVDIRAELAQRFEFPVFLQNDASAACGAELVFGQSETPQDFLYFYVGYFIGGGVVLNGGLYAGRSGNAGALGSLPIASDTGKSQQLIDVASLSVIEAQLSATGADSASLWQPPAAWDVDPGILADWIEGAAAGIAYAIAAAISVIDFEAVLIDGWIPAEVREQITRRTSAHLDMLNLAGLTRPDIREGTVGPDARALGAASLPLSERFLIDTNALLKAG